MNLDNVIGTNEASEIMRLSPAHVKLLCRQGKIYSKRIGNTWVIDKMALIAQSRELIRSFLLNQEMSLSELDEFMVELNYGTEDGWVDWEGIVQDKQVAYTKDGEYHEIIKFEVLFTSGEDEDVSATQIKITDVVLE